jgi:predicted RNase H-like HicB family nuclease
MTEPNHLDEYVYTVVYEGEGTSWSAYVPDLPACVAAGESKEEVRGLIREAIVFYLEHYAASGRPAPPPGSRTEMIRIQGAELHPAPASVRVDASA